MHGSGTIELRSKQRSLYNLQDLLRHPLCLTLVRQKWVKYGRRTFYAELLLYLIFLVSLSAFVLSSPSPLTHPHLYNCSNVFPNATASQGTENTGVVKATNVASR